MTAPDWFPLAICAAVLWQFVATIALAWWQCWYLRRALRRTIERVFGDD